MNANFSFSALLILTTLLVVPLAHADGDSQDPVTVIEVNAANEFVTREENAVILDVRTPAEYEMSHISGSVNVDVQDKTFDETVSALDPNKTYIVHCTANPADGRSNRALETLQDLGFKHLYSLEGGYVAWKDAELPLTEPSD
jgi:rhodanese-related sulfurtransferase